MTSDSTPRNPRSTTRYDLVEGRIVMEAAKLFAERGFAGTSLKDIAEATGLTRPALYHYVRSKEDILSKLVTELAELPAQALRAVNAEKTLSPPERLRRMAFAVAHLQATGPAKFQLLIRSEADLPSDLVERYADSRRKVLREFVGVIEAGIDSGAFRTIDPRIAALSIIGQCNWVAWWHHGGTPEENERVADQLADLAVASVLAADDAHLEDDPARRALARVRRELDYLEQVIDD